jgi:RNA polymerase sigma factor (sigma-70 family)
VAFFILMAESAADAAAWKTPVGAMTSDAGTFEEFFEAERDRLLKTFTMITGSRAEAEDIVQDAFVNVWQRWDRIAALEDPRAYLNRACVNGFRSRARRAKVALRHVVRPVPDPDALAAVDDRDEARRLLAALTPRQRAALLLTELWDMTAEEAGRSLGIKASTVRALAYQARSASRASKEDAGV